LNNSLNSTKKLINIQSGVNWFPHATLRHDGYQTTST